MRRPAAVLLAALVAALPLCALAQQRQGVYAPGGATGTPWSINEHHALIWGGLPYIPFGIRIDATPAAIKAATEAGVHDLLVDLPAGGGGWLQAVTSLEEQKARYLIRINSLAPMARGFAVEPQAYRITGIDKPRSITIELPGADSALVVLAAKRDSAVAAKERLPVINGRLTYQANPGPGYEHILLIYPEMSSIEQPDYWEALDAHRDTLLTSLRRFPMGAGLRGIVNPMGRVLSLPGKDPRFTPTSPFFRLELRNYLENRYKSLETAKRSWSMSSNDIESFDQMSRLVPLWSGARGVSQLFDPSTNKLYPCDNRYSAAWRDIAQVLSTAGTRRYDRLVAAIRGVADVPVVQEWSGWAAPYENPTPALDGIGMRAQGLTPSAIAESASRSTSSLLRWQTRGWLFASDVDLGGGGEAAAQLPVVIGDLVTLGAKGFFIRADSPSLIPALNAIREARSQDVTLASSSPSAVFYPENATHPAAPQRLPGGKWWLPSPSDGNRLDLGKQFSGYRIQEGENSQLVIWARTPGRYRLRMSNTKGVQFQAVDGSDVAPKIVKNGVEVTIGQVPLVVTGTTEVPIPELAFVETVAHFDHLSLLAQKAMTDMSEERIFFKEQVNGFERNPGGSFPQMRQQLYKLSYKVGKFTWLEAERSPTTNFSEAVAIPGVSAGSALILRTSMLPGVEGYTADYRIGVRTQEDQEVWIAARIPAERRENVTVFVGDQMLKIQGEPVNLYGSGFGWYKLGTTKLAGNTSNIRVQVDSPGPELALDVILLTPRPFLPAGVTMPDAVDLPDTEKPKS